MSSPHSSVRWLAITLLTIASLGSLVWSQASASSRGVVDNSAASPSTSGGYFALISGNDNYKYLPKLKTASADANAIAQLLREHYGFTTTIVLDGTRNRVLTALNEYRRILPADSKLLIYYAGHGHHDPETDKAYWLPVDAQPDNNENWISADDITSDVRAIPSQHVLIISDSCYSGVLTRGAEVAISPQERGVYLAKMSKSKSRNLMSSGGDEPVLDSGGEGHSIFADAILGSLRQIDELQFTAAELFHRFVQVGVAGRSDQVPQYSLIRNSGHEFGDFVFLRKGGGAGNAPNTASPATNPAPVNQGFANAAVSHPAPANSGMTFAAQSSPIAPQNAAPASVTNVPFAVVHYGSLDLTQNCVGWVTLEPGMMHYRAVQGADGMHSFDFPAQSIKEIKKNALVGIALQAFHIRLNTGEVYNFSLFDPNTKTFLNADSLILAIHQVVGK